MPDAPELDVAGLYRRHWGVALKALRRLMANGEDTEQAFTIMRSLNGAATPKGYKRLIESPHGGKLAFEHEELAERLSDRAWIDGFAPGTVGAAYRAFVDRTGYSADGLAETSGWQREGTIEHPYAWFGRRTRDVHDIWHVLTGYHADEILGEACLVAFSFGQTGGLGWGAIASGAVLKSVRETRSPAFARAVWEGWRRGRRAVWLLGEDYDALLAEPMADARRRLKLGEAPAYDHARAAMGKQLETFGRPAKAAQAG